MINKLTRYNYFEKTEEFEQDNEGIWVDFDEVKELLANQEKKINIFLSAFENIIKQMEYCSYDDNCPEDSIPYGECAFCISKRALEEYKKE